MEVISTSVSLETEKTSRTCNFQTMAKIFLFMLHDLMSDQKNGNIHISKYEAICHFMMTELWKSVLSNPYTQNSKIKTNQQ